MGFASYGGGFAQGMHSGMAIGDRIAAAIERAGLADASNSVKMEMGDNTGSEAAQEYGNTAQSLDGPQYENLTPEERQAAQKAYTSAAGDALKSGQQYKAGGKTFASEDAAKAALPGLRNAATADYYRSRGEVEKANAIEQNSRRAEAESLQLNSARRADQLGAAGQGLELAKTENAYKTLKDDLKAQVLSKKLDTEGLRRRATGEWVNAATTRPDLANHMLEDPDFQGVLGITDVERVPGSKDELVITAADGSKGRTSISALKQYAQGGPLPVKFETLKEGEKLLAVDPKNPGRLSEVASYPKTPDNSKNDAQMDDASSVMTKLLDTNKTMMTQFGGDESKIRQSAVLNHERSIGEFKRLNGRAPTREEASIIAKASFDKATSSIVKK